MRPSRDLRTALMSVYAHNVLRAKGNDAFIPAAGRRLGTSSGNPLGLLSEQTDVHAATRFCVAQKQVDPTCAPMKSAAPDYQVDPGEIVPRFLDSNTITYKVTSHVTRPFAHMKYILDPRSWGKCSDFFDPRNTYQIKTDEKGVPLRDAKDRLVEEKDGPPIGDPWEGLLRERFDGPGVAVDNILVIRHQPTPRRIKVQYGLYLSESCTLGPFGDVGGLLRNTGDVVAEMDGKRVAVTVTKTLSFFDYTPGDIGDFVDFGSSLSMLMAIMGVGLVGDKFVLKLNCHLEPTQATRNAQPKAPRKGARRR
jgi:hypothetical protein